eukprot:7309801-Lingulodinium_polyedra.AAC.1
MPLKTQSANAHTAAHAAPRSRISASRAHTHVCDAIRVMASAGCFLSLCTCAWRLPEPLSQDTHTLHFQRRTT